MAVMSLEAVEERPDSNVRFCLIAYSADKACCWPPIFRYNETIQSSESDAEFSTLCGNRNERPILEPTLRLFSTLCGFCRVSH